MCVVRGGWIGVGRGAVVITGRHACWPCVLYGTHGCWVAREDACRKGRGADGVSLLLVIYCFLHVLQIKPNHVPYLPTHIEYSDHKTAIVIHCCPFIYCHSLLPQCRASDMCLTGHRCAAWPARGSRRGPTAPARTRGGSRCPPGARLGAGTAARGPPGGRRRARTPAEDGPGHRTLGTA